MRSRPILVAVAVLVLLAVGGGAAAWALILSGDQVAPLSLPSRAPATSTGTSALDPSPSSGGLPVTSAAPVDAASLPGTWTIAADSVVGYRVRERLASLPADSDAVGRTSGITGTATITASGATLTVSAAAFSVNMTSLASDRAMRDNRLRGDGIQTDSFPTSTFTLTTPVALPAAATTGAQVDITLHGDLLLHGVTKTVDIPAKAQLNGGLIQVVGSLTFPFSDFAINPPSIGGFVAVQVNGTLEFLENLAKG
jgi:polyisoprenoid-binding protein YceI